MNLYSRPTPGFLQGTANAIFSVRTARSTERQHPLEYYRLNTQPIMSFPAIELVAIDASAGRSRLPVPTGAAEPGTETSLDEHDPTT